MYNLTVEDIEFLMRLVESEKYDHKLDIAQSYARNFNIKDRRESCIEMFKAFEKSDDYSDMILEKLKELKDFFVLVEKEGNSILLKGIEKIKWFHKNKKEISKK